LKVEDGFWFLVSGRPNSGFKGNFKMKFQQKKANEDLISSERTGVEYENK